MVVYSLDDLLSRHEMKKQKSGQDLVVMQLQLALRMNLVVGLHILLVDMVDGLQALP